MCPGRDVGFVSPTSWKSGLELCLSEGVNVIFMTCHCAGSPSLLLPSPRHCVDFFRQELPVRKISQNTTTPGGKGLWLAAAN